MNARSRIVTRRLRPGLGFATPFLLVAWSCGGPPVEEPACEVAGAWRLDEKLTDSTCDPEEFPASVASNLLLTVEKTETSYRLGLSRGGVALSECSGEVVECKAEMTCSHTLEEQDLSAAYELTFAGDGTVSGQETISFSVGDEPQCQSGYALGGRREKVS